MKSYDCSSRPNYEKIAKELHYGKEIIEQIKACKTDIEKENIMRSARLKF